MNRRDFIKVASAGFGTLLVSGLGVSLIKADPAHEFPAGSLRLKL